MASLKQVRGEVHPGWEGVQAQMQRNSEWEEGAAFVVFSHGECVASVSIGAVDPDPPERPDGSPAEIQPYTPRTLQLVASSTKFITSVCMAMLVDRGLLSYSTPISSVWPEFGHGGKEHITVAQLMMHQAGVCAMDQPLDVEHFRSLEAMGAHLACQQLSFPVPDLREVEVERIGADDGPSPPPQALSR